MKELWSGGHRKKHHAFKELNFDDVKNITKDFCRLIQKQKLFVYNIALSFTSDRKISKKEVNQLKREAYILLILNAIDEWTSKNAQPHIYFDAEKPSEANQIIHKWAQDAFEFGMRISAEFKIYLIKEFQRLKDEEQKQLGWDIKRNLAKINYRIHTDAIKENLIPPELTSRQINLVYASEADILNMALFGMTAGQWRDANPDKKGNIRDYANVSQLVCLSNLENLNALFINEGISQSERLAKLNQVAIQQMRLLTDDSGVRRLEGGK